MKCEFCGQDVKPHDRGLRQYVAGWALVSRSGGGTHHIEQRETFPRFECAACATARKYGAESQLTLFADDPIVGFPEMESR